MTGGSRETNWGRWGDTDERGAANLLTPTAVLSACGRPKKGQVYELGIELKRGAPVSDNRISPMHFMTQDGGDFSALDRLDWGTADDYLLLATQGTTHVDGLAHIWSGGKLYNGFPFTEVRSSGTGRLGLEKLGGLVASVHLLDFTHLCGPDAPPITAELVDTVFAARGAQPQPGDAVLFRTGWMEEALQGTPDAAYHPVVSASMAEWFADLDISIVGADNIAVEATAQRGTLPPLHKVLVRDLGVTLIELLHLREPGEDRVESGMLVVAPLRIYRGVGEPGEPAPHRLSLGPMVTGEFPTIRGRSAVIGVGSTKQGELPGQTADEIGVDAFKLALEDCGLQKSDIDGLITCKSFGGSGIDTEIGRLAGLNPRYSATLDYGTCNFSLHLATMVIAAGMATTVALIYGTNQRTAGNRFRSAAGSGSGSLELHGFHNMAGPAAMAFSRHSHLYGTTEEQLGWVAVTERAHAQLNPAAIFQKPLTIEDYLSEPYMVQPLRRSDICMISDGGACLIVTAAERVREVSTKPAYVLGTAQVTALRQYQNPDNLMRPWVADMAQSVYEHSGLSRSDIDVLFVQDPTSVWVCQMLEWFGFCGIGESGPFIQEGRIRIGGDIPVNTNGGQLSESYMWGWLHLCEAVRQLRGSCGERQVSGAKFAQYCSTKGFEKAATSILGTEVPA